MFVTQKLKIFLKNCDKLLKIINAFKTTSRFFVTIIIKAVLINLRNSLFTQIIPNKAYNFVQKTLKIEVLPQGKVSH